jgi:hypothetical protein
MDPAYEIHLNEQELAQLGKLTAILGQVDDLMVETIARLLNVDRDAANWIMGSSKVADNTEIWEKVIKNRTADEDVLWLIEHVKKEIVDISRSRNDFIHAVFWHLTQTDGFSFFSQNSVARRVRNTTLRPVTELPEIINQSARLSCLVAHIDHLIAGNPAASSTWLERLGPSLPLRSDTALERKAKALRGRRKS